MAEDPDGLAPECGDDWGWLNEMTGGGFVVGLVCAVLFAAGMLIGMAAGLALLNGGVEAASAALDRAGGQ